jgi:hypothetical protein
MRVISTGALVCLWMKSQGQMAVWRNAIKDGMTLLLSTKLADGSA